MILALGLLAPACGSNGLPAGLGGSSDDDNGSSSGSSQGELITIPVDVADQDAGFALAPATDFSILVEGCVSKQTDTATAADPDINVFKFDQGCRAKLTTFVTNGLTYIPTAGDPFTTWLAGDTATFEDQANPANLIAVSVTSTLDDPISGTEAVQYGFSQITAGIDQAVSASAVSDSHNFSVEGQAAPDFTITNVSFVGITGTGAGQFVFDLQCNLGQTAGTTTAVNCGDVSLADLDYKLIKDTFGSTMDISQAATIFATAGTSIQDTDVTNGIGFGTATLDGPDEIALNSNMILIIRAGGASFQYFNVDVSAINP